MAPQPSAPGAQPPPDLPSDPSVSDTLTNYLRNFALWCRNMFGDKLDAHRGLPGLMISSYGATVQNPPVYFFGVNAAGQATLAPMAMGSGAMGAPVPLLSMAAIETLQARVDELQARIETLEAAR